MLPQCSRIGVKVPILDYGFAIAVENVKAFCSNEARYPSAFPSFLRLNASNRAFLASKFSCRDIASHLTQQLCSLLAFGLHSISSHVGASIACSHLAWMISHVKSSGTRVFSAIANANSVETFQSSLILTMANPRLQTGYSK